MPSDEQKNSPPPAGPPPEGEHEDRPSVPAVPRPGREQVLRRMTRVDPDLARRYRQKSGQ